MLASIMHILCTSKEIEKDDDITVHIFWNLNSDIYHVCARFTFSFEMGFECLKKEGGQW